MTKKERYNNVIEWFQENMPVAETELQYRDPYSLMVAVVLSAQCTDKRVNMITPGFFKKYPTVQVLAKAEVKNIFECIKSCSYPNNKAKHLSAAAKKIMKEYQGKLPEEIDELQKLPGIGRKSANVIASVAFGKPAIAVDTHVFRVAARIGLAVNSKTPIETEKQLTQNIPQNLWSKAHHWLILHGRYICTSRSPKCKECGLRFFCRYYCHFNDKK